MNQTDKIFLARAIQLARENVAIGGGPFGAVIVKNGQTVAESANQVISIPDPTAHAEIQTIRLAAKNLKTFDLTGTTLYTSCEPCPMCLGAVYWSRISRVVYASDRHDAEKAGFRDAELYLEIALDPDQRVTPFEHLYVLERGLEFTDWKNSDIKLDY
ncbi:MAG: nucleoside deaminase [Bacteroidales bacterium]